MINWSSLSRSYLRGEYKRAAVCEKWKRPEGGWTKLNVDDVDGALDLANSIAGIGTVARGDDGRFLVASCRKYLVVVEPFIAEILACRDALNVPQGKELSVCSS